MINPFAKNKLSIKKIQKHTATKTSILKAYAVCVGTSSKTIRSGLATIVFCCFHDDGKKPSLALYEGTESYYCFTCGAHGDTYTFIKERQGLDFIGAVKFAEENGVVL